MNLIKVRDNQNRPINWIDVIFGAVFGNEVPREFIPGDSYQIGEHVYKVDGAGNLLIYECTKAGVFYNCTEPEFKEWTLDGIMNKYNDAIISINDIFINNKVGDLVLYDFSSLRKQCVSEIEDGKLKIKADLSEMDISKYMNRYNTLDVFVRFDNADNYILPSEYSFEGSKISINMDLKSSILSKSYTSNFYPEGTITETPISTQLLSLEDYPEIVDVNESTQLFSIPDTQSGEPYFWYGENGESKTYKFNDSGLNLKDFDVLREIGKDKLFGYRVCDFKIESIHTVVPSELNDLQNTKVYRLDEFIINGKHDSISSELSDTTQTITIPISVEPTNDITDELRVVFNKNNQLLNITSKNGYIKQVKYSLVAKKLNPDSVYVLGGSSRSDMTRYLRQAYEVGSIVKINGEDYIEFPNYDMFKYNSFDFDLYVNRVRVSKYEHYMDETGKLYIKLLEEEYVDYDQNNFLFHIYYSISQGVGIVKTSDENIVTDDKDAFRIFLTTEFINKHQWLRLYKDFENIPPEVTVGSKTSANISDPDYYLTFGETMKADVFTMYFQDIKRLNGSMKDGCNSESYPIMETTRNLNVPFANYNADNDDFLIFKTGGVLLNSSKWYLNDKQVNLYIHETPMSYGDYVDFRLLDRDKNIRVYNKFFTASENNQTVFNILSPTEKRPIFFMLFTMSGEFISPSKYTLDGYTITFNTDCRQPVEIQLGTRFEAVYGIYTGDVCKTLYHTIQIKSTSDNQKEFLIDETVDFNMDTNNLLIFREDGMYVGEKFYHIDRESNKIIIDKGTGVANGSHIDVIVIRNLSLEVPVEIE